MQDVMRSGPPISGAEFWSGIGLIGAFAAWSVVAIALAIFLATSLDAWGYLVGLLIWLMPVFVRRNHGGRANRQPK